MSVPEFDIVLTLAAPAPKGREEMEAHAFEVLSAVEEYGADIALGPVVAANFATSSIELGYSVIAATLQDANATASKISDLIAKHTTIKFQSMDTTVREPVACPPLALVS